MKILVLNYTFDASAKTVTFTDYNPIVLERVLLITNVTDGVIIYNFADVAKGGTAGTNILTLTYNTTTMDDTDKLQIFYDDSATTQPISGSITATQATGTNLHVVVDTAPTTAVTGTFYQATQPVSLASVPSHAVTNAGTFATQATLAAGTAEVGSLLPPDTDVTAHTNYARKYYTNAGAVTDGIIWSPAAEKRWHVVTLYLQTSAAATITIEDDKAGGDDPVWKGEIAANSGVTLSFTEQYPMASGEDAADLIITTTAGNVYVTVVGYEI